MMCHAGRILTQAMRSGGMDSKSKDMVRELNIRGIRCFQSIHAVLPHIRRPGLGCIADQATDLDRLIALGVVEDWGEEG